MESEDSKNRITKMSDGIQDAIRNNPYPAILTTVVAGIILFLVTDSMTKRDQVTMNSEAVKNLNVAQQINSRMIEKNSDMNLDIAIMKSQFQDMKSHLDDIKQTLKHINSRIDQMERPSHQTYGSTD